MPSCKFCDGTGKRHSDVEKVTCLKCEGKGHYGTEYTFRCRDCDERGYILVERSNTFSCPECKGSGWREPRFRECWKCNGCGIAWTIPAHWEENVYVEEEVKKCSVCEGSGQIPDD
jgi:DnaJ-class molecular chaperone